MKLFETTTRVEPSGEVRVVGVPFSAGTEVDVSIRPKRAHGSEFRAEWERVCRQLRSVTSVRAIGDEDIQAEIAAYRAER